MKWNANRLCMFTRGARTYGTRFKWNNIVERTANRWHRKQWAIYAMHFCFAVVDGFFCFLFLRSIFLLSSDGIWLLHVHSRNHNIQKMQSFSAFHSRLLIMIANDWWVPIAHCPLSQLRFSHETNMQTKQEKEPRHFVGKYHSFDIFGLFSTGTRHRIPHSSSMPNQKSIWNQLRCYFRRAIVCTRCMRHNSTHFSSLSLTEWNRLNCVVHSALSGV